MDIKLFVSVLCCGLCLIVSAESDYEYYGYDVYYRNSKSTRSKRYVDHVINRLADTGDPSRALHDKDSSDGDVGGGGVMEMVGNVAVHESSFPPSSSTASPVSTDQSSLHPDEMEKPVKDWSGKKSAPAEKKTVTKAVTGYEGFRHSSPTSALPTSTTPADHSDAPIQEADSYPEQITNTTLGNHSITTYDNDTFKYYNTSFIEDPNVGMAYWVDMDHEPDVVNSSMLSSSHRRAVTVPLKFNFPFYGHYVQSVTIATGGFLYTGDYIHSWLAATQYIAPLMANFDTSISPASTVRYRDNGTALTVEWCKVLLQDRHNAGDFTFQATLHSSGDIVFVYKSLPIEVGSINDQLHPVKVGLSDAYIIDKTIFYMRRKTIYEYHRVNFKKEVIKNWTVILLHALPTCLNNKDCNSCLTADLRYQCFWCDNVSRCSSGVDRMRQEWQSSNCDKSAINDVNSCGITVPSHVHLPQIAVQQGSVMSGSRGSAAEMSAASQPRGSDTSSATSSMLGATVAIVLIAGVALWLFYAYRNPHTPSGQVLIKYRPSQWTQWRRGEARYTAASIHM